MIGIVAHKCRQIACVGLKKVYGTISSKTKIFHENSTVDFTFRISWQRLYIDVKIYRLTDGKKYSIIAVKCGFVDYFVEKDVNLLI